MSILVVVGGAHDIVEAGLRAILGTDPAFSVMDDYSAHGVVPDVVLYDAIAVELDGGAELSRLVREQDSAFVVVGRDLRPDLGATAVRCGADGVVSIEAPAAEILATIRSAAAGELQDQPAPHPHLGVEAGLTEREVDVLSRITKGMNNHDIAAELGLSINSIKSYIRSAYRKMDVTTRTQAVSWCVRHGFEL